ncbi:MAG: hypothetical protein AAF810_08220, partial [Cyanobacteria bacterium P01_D01_bin.36]
APLAEDVAESGLFGEAGSDGAGSDEKGLEESGGEASSTLEKYFEEASPGDQPERSGQMNAESDAAAGFFSVSSVSSASSGLPEGEEELVLQELESEMGLDEALSLELDSDFALELSESSSGGAEPSSDFGAALELESTPAFVPDLSGNSGDALDADLSQGLGSAVEASVYPSTEFTLPGEAPTLDSADLDLPTVDLPIMTPTVGGSSDFFSLTDEADEVADAEHTEVEDGATESDELELSFDEASVAVDKNDLALETEFSSVAATIGLASPVDDAVEDVEDLPTLEMPMLTDETVAEAADEAAFEAVDETADEEELADMASAVEPALDVFKEDETPLAEDSFELDNGEVNIVDSKVSLEGPEEAPEEGLEEAPETDEPTLSEASESELSDSNVTGQDTDDVSAELSNPLASDDLVPDDLSDLSLDESQLSELDLSDVEIDVESSSVVVDSDGDLLELEPDVDDLSDDSLDESADEFLGASALELSDRMPSDEPQEDDSEIDGPEETELEQSELEQNYAVAGELAAADPTTADESDGDSASTAYEYEEVEHDEDDSTYYLEDAPESDDDDELEDYYEETVASVDETEVQRQREQWQQQTKGGNPMVIVGAVGFLFAGVVGFLLTRPCTVGSCDRIEAAQAKGDDAINNLRIDGSLDAVTASKKELQESIALLEPIPVWSGHYNEAQAILPEYDRQLSALDLVTKAQGEAYTAAVKSQNPPHSVSTWQEIASGWRSAISSLSAVPEESPVSDLARRKLAEYRANLSTILVRIETESGAEQSLRQAQQAGTRATQQTQTADSSEAWEAVLSDWETAVENLRRIPQGSSAYAEAQQILPEYEASLQSARERTERERGANRLLFRAQQLATEAQQAEAEELWTTAVENWNLAVIQLRDVPDETYARSSAQSLLTTYTGALGTAENNMEVSLRFQPVEPSFYLVCGISDIQKCSYSVKAGKVRLDLAQGYDSVIEESITPPPERTGVDADAQLVTQSNQLLQQITLLSTQGQLPVELYDAEGEFLARYQPDLDGFVKQ